MEYSVTYQRRQLILVRREGKVYLMKESETIVIDYPINY